MAQTLFEYYQQQGQALPSFEERAGVYEQKGLGSAGSYAGSAEQNTRLLQGLQSPATPLMAPTIVSSSAARSTTTSGAEFLNNFNLSLAGQPSLPAPAPAPAPALAPALAPAPAPIAPLAITPTSQSQKSVVDEINRLLQDPSVMQALPADLRNQIAQANTLDAQMKTEAVNAETALRNKQYGIFNQAVENIKTYQTRQNEALGAFQAQIAPLRERYLQTLLPTAKEKELGTQLTDLKKKQQEFELSLQEGVEKEFGLGRPLAISTGRGRELERQAQFEKQQMQIEESNLLTRLGLTQEARKLEAGVIDSLAIFAREDRDFAVKLIEQQENREEKILDLAFKYDSLQRNIAADTLEQFKDTNPQTASPEVQAQISSIMSRYGINPSEFNAMWQTAYDGGELDRKIKEARVRTEVAEEKDVFTQTQENKGAANAGVSLDEFALLDTDSKNVFINRGTEIGKLKNSLRERLQDGEKSEVIKSEIDAGTFPDGAKRILKDFIDTETELTEEDGGFWGFAKDVLDFFLPT